MMRGMKPTSISRRRFLAGSAAAIAAPMIIPDSVLGRQGRASPNSRITMACLGYGMMGTGNTDSFLGQPDTQILAVCDLDQHRLEAAKNTVDGRYNNKDCAAVHDFREVIARNDIDALMLALPVTGWLMSSAAGIPVKFLELFTLPDLIDRDDFLFQRLIDVHQALAWALIAFIAVHAAAALRHHFAFRDDTLRRMLP